MQELQNPMVFLMSEQYDYITGQMIGIDKRHHLAARSAFAALSKLIERR